MSLSVMQLMQIRESNREAAKRYDERGEISPAIAFIISVGDDDGCQSYIKLKTDVADKYGIDIIPVHYEKPNNVSDINEICKGISENILHCNKSGIPVMMQLPLEGMRDKEEHLAKLISKAVDIDGLNPNYTIEARREYGILAPCTAYAVKSIVDGLGVKNKRCSVIGRSTIVGKPIVDLLIESGHEVTVFNSMTHYETLEEYNKLTDVIIGTASRLLVFDYSTMVDKVVIDTGFLRINGKISGCIPTEAKRRYAKMYNEATGEVGPLTIEYLMHNILQVNNQPTI